MTGVSFWRPQRKEGKAWKARRTKEETDERVCLNKCVRVRLLAGGEPFERADEYPVWAALGECRRELRDVRFGLIEARH